MKQLLLFFLLISTILFSQDVQIPDYYEVAPQLSQQLQTIVQNLGLDQIFNVGEDGIEQISLAVLDLNMDTVRLGGVNFDNFIYPASVYKIYVAAEILHQIAENKAPLTRQYVVKTSNVVDTVKEILVDPRPLLADGDTVTIDYLLDLMITRSDDYA